jgi:hypothetical protein
MKMKIDKKYLDSLIKRPHNELSSHFIVMIVPLRTKNESNYNNIAVIGCEFDGTCVLISRKCDVIKFIGNGNLRIEVGRNSKKFQVFNINEDYRVYAGYDTSTLVLSDSPIKNPPEEEI